ncbi:hypothetical protein [Paraburkholderia sp. J10-1]|uniref:hypothetical protein n=1 Tax=Paraburkholderia sp. J10-1 TaxID=2805430 RepID=UPI002AB72458|nr:hypothetical protein [Paraburkholderia sp. J10-1]
MEQAAFLLGFPAACALVGWLIGRLIRGPRPRIELERPRLAISSVFLRDAHNDRVSNLTRYRCAFEAIYFSLCEVAETRGFVVEEKEHPSDELMRVALDALDSKSEDSTSVSLLARWAADTNPTMPGVSMKDACKLAVRIHQKTVSLLSSPVTH